MPRDDSLVHRRTVLTTTGATLAGLALAGCSGGGESGDGGGSDGDDTEASGDGGDTSVPAAVESYMDGVGNYDGVEDLRGDGDVTVDVGSAANGGNFGFSPAAIRIDAGQTVVWEWTGEGGDHNVVDEDGAFESELVGEADHTFEHTFESSGTFTYACDPHKTVGMKGAVIVE